MQSPDDIVYEQDILRDPGSIKPWLTYVDYKHQFGTLLEQSFVGSLRSILGPWHADSVRRCWREPARSYQDLTNYGKWYVKSHQGVLVADAACSILSFV